MVPARVITVPDCVAVEVTDDQSSARTEEAGVPINDFVSNPDVQEFAGQLVRPQGNDVQSVHAEWNIPGLAGIAWLCHFVAGGAEPDCYPEPDRAQNRRLQERLSRASTDMEF